MKKTRASHMLRRILNEQLVPLLNLDPIYNAHSLYVCGQQPGSESLVAVSAITGRIEAVLVTGRPDVFLLQGYWSTAENRLAAGTLLDELKSEPGFTLNYPLWAQECVRRRFPAAKDSVDQLYVRTRETFDDSFDECQGAVNLTSHLYHSMVNTDRFLNRVLPQDLLPESRFYSIVEQDRLCAIGECILETDSAGVISQMFTLDEYRGRGYAKKIAYALTQSILARHKIPIAFFSEENAGSRRVFESMGYTLYLRLGCMEFDTEEHTKKTENNR